MTDLKELIEREIDQYLEWPTADKSHVTTASAKLFAEHVAQLHADQLRGGTKKIGRPQIREVFMRNGARIEPDRDDLPDWVYESVFELLEMAAPAVQGEPVAEVSQETFSSDGTSDIITKNLPIGMRLYAAPQPAEQQPVSWIRIRGDHVILSRCNWMYPASTEDSAGPRDEQRFTAVGRRDGDIVLPAPEGALDREDLKTMLAWPSASKPAEQQPESISRNLRAVHAMILSALDRDAADGKAVRGEMAAELRSAISEQQPAPDVAGLVEALQAECKKLRKVEEQYRRLIELGEDFQWENIIRVDISDFPSRADAINATLQKERNP